MIQSLRLTPAVRRTALSLLALASSGVAGAWGQDLAASTRPSEFGDAGIEQKIGDSLPLDSQWLDSSGKAVRLGDYFGERPVVLLPVYYRCPMLCTLTLESLVKSLKVLTFDAGSEYDVVAFSFNPAEGPADAAPRRQSALDLYNRGLEEPRGDDGWHFLSGDEAAVRELTEAIGFRATLDTATSEYIHAASVLLVTPDGRISRYFYGIEYPPKNLRLGLVEASERRLGTAVDQVLLYCYRYNPATGKYTLLTMRLLRIGGLLTLIGLGALITVLLRLEKHPKAHHSRATAQEGLS